MRNFTFIDAVVAIILLLVVGQVNGQILFKPALGNNTPAGKWDKACASPTFNGYNITLSFNVASIQGGNQFILELSDETGDFSNPVVLFTSAADAITSSPKIVNVSMPTDVSGDAYRIRLKSTAPVAMSSPTDSFPAYYQIHNEGFTINGLVETGVYCSGGSYLLTIDNPTVGGGTSPLDFPTLTYNWFQVINSTTEVPVGTGSSLSVNTPGTYLARTNYGDCGANSPSFSNTVTISESGGGGSNEIKSSLGNPYCASLGKTLLTSVGGGSEYRWFKDGQEIEGITGPTYETDESGVYSVDINLGTCSTSASINLDANQFNAEIDVDVSPAVNLLPVDGALMATVSTSAANPEYEWYLNDNLIPNEDTDSYEATQTGSYKVVVKQTVGCVSSREILFEIQEPFPDVEKIPNVISPNGDGVNDTWVVPQSYVSGTNTEIVLFSAQGQIVFQTNDYQNNWPIEDITFKDINPVYYYIITTEDQKTRKGSLTVIK